jgi:hypothetical protein
MPCGENEDKARSRKLLTDVEGLLQHNDPGETPMETVLQNLRFSLRMLARNPGLTLTVLLTLAIGIGANTAIFTVDYATLLAPLPYPQPDQLVMVWSRIQNFHNGVSAGDFLDWKQQSTVFQDLCALAATATTWPPKISRSMSMPAWSQPRSTRWSASRS